MNNIKELSKNTEFIKGKDIIKSIDKYTGLILKCTGFPVAFGSEALDDIVIVTNDIEKPLVSLKDGILWREDIEECLFQKINYPIQIN